jgi:hypothetical protein
MKNTLEARRQKLLRQIAKVDRQIVKTQERVANLEARMAVAGHAQQQAA